MKNEIKRAAVVAAILVALASLAQAQARDGATQSAPSATAPSSGGARASGGVGNGIGDPKDNRAANVNGRQGTAGGIGSGTSPGINPNTGAVTRTGAAGDAKAATGRAERPDQTAQPDQDARLSKPDRLALRDAAQAHLFQIDLAGLATANSGNPLVRSYAAKMLEDHAKALDSLRGIARRGGVILPGGLESTQAATLHALSLKTGTDLDQAYLGDAGTALQQQEMTLFQGLAKSAQSESVRRYALEQTALAHRHLQLTETMSGPPQVAANALSAARSAGQSVSSAAAPNTSSNRQQDNGGNAGAGSIAGSAVHPSK